MNEPPEVQRERMNDLSHLTRRKFDEENMRLLHCRCLHFVNKLKDWKLPDFVDVIDHYFQDVPVGDCTDDRLGSALPEHEAKLHRLNI
jgi:hypothetical protein